MDWGSAGRLILLGERVAGIRKRPVSPALLNPTPIAETADLKALGKVGVKVNGGRNDRDHHEPRAASSMER